MLLQKVEAGIAMMLSLKGICGVIFDWNNIDKHILKEYSHMNPRECQLECKKNPDCVAWETCNCGNPEPG